MATVFPGYSDIVQNLQQAIRAILERHDYVPAQDQVRDLPNLLATLQTYVVSLTGSCRRLGDAYVNALRVYLDAIQRLLSERSSAGQGRAMVYSAGAPNQVGGLRPRQKPELQPPSDVVERRNSLPTRLPLVDAAQLHRAVSHDVGPCTFPESARLALDSVMTDVLGEVAHRLGSVSVLEDAEGTPSDEDVRRALHQVLASMGLLSAFETTAARTQGDFGERSRTHLTRSARARAQRDEQEAIFARQADAGQLDATGGTSAALPMSATPGSQGVTPGGTEDTPGPSPSA